MHLTLDWCEVIHGDRLTLIGSEKEFPASDLVQRGWPQRAEGARCRLVNCRLTALGSDSRTIRPVNCLSNARNLRETKMPLFGIWDDSTGITLCAGGGSFYDNDQYGSWSIAMVMMTGTTSYGEYEAWADLEHEFEFGCFGRGKPQ